MAQTVVGVFDTHEKAVAGVHELREAGFLPAQVSIFAPDVREYEGYTDEVGVRVVQAGTLGIVAGGAVGGLSGWVLGLTGLLIPGVGAIALAGPLAGVILGLIGGTALGGFVGMLVGLGLPRHAAEQYTRELQEGRTLVVVHPDGRVSAAEAALHHASPLGLHHYEEKVGGELVESAGGTSLPPVPEC